MDLITALGIVDSDVADRVYRDPTVADSARHAREETTEADMVTMKADQEDGVFEELGDVYGAYVAVRDATQEDVDAAVIALDYRND